MGGRRGIVSSYVSNPASSRLTAVFTQLIRLNNVSCQTKLTLYRQSFWFEYGKWIY